MPARPLESLLAAVVDARVVGEPGALITGIQYDSRKVRPGDLFVALVGGYADGHDYVDGAVARGAAAVLAERMTSATVPQVLTANSRAALAPIAAEFYGHPSKRLPVIGVTGTDGKTTTSHLIETIMTYSGRTAGMIGTIGVRLGDRHLESESRQTTPESLDVQRHLHAMVEGGASVAIIEATSHGLDLHRLDSTEFAVGAVTSITHEHLEHHKTIPAYRRAKAKLFEAVARSGGQSVINIDDEGAREMLAYVGDRPVITYSAAGASADLTAVDVELGVDQTRFRLAFGGATLNVATPLIGQFNVANALCAIGVALASNASLQDAIVALARARPISGRMQMVRRGQPFSVVVDYAHTPDSIEKVLVLLKQLNPAGRRILVMGSAGERDRDKRPLQGAVAARYADFSVFTTEDPRFEDADAIIAEIAAGALEHGAVEGVDFMQITDRRDAIAHALSIAREGDSVLLAGKGHERSIIWGSQKRPWDEAAVASDLLESLGFARSDECV